GRHDLEPEAFDLLGRERRAGAGGVRVAWTRFVNALPLARGDFYARVRLALEEEAAAIPRRALRGIVLASGITDLAAAAGNRRFFERLLRGVRRRLGLSPAVQRRAASSTTWRAWCRACTACMRINSGRL